MNAQCNSKQLTAMYLSSSDACTVVQTVVKPKGQSNSNGQMLTLTMALKP